MLEHYPVRNHYITISGTKQDDCQLAAEGGPLAIL